MKTKLGFGIADLGGNMFFTLMGFYLLFYFTDIVKLPAALAGTAIMIGKIWDAFTDPVTGYLSDKTRTKWGRRRPYIFVGAILCLVGMAAIFSTPNASTPAGLFTIATLLFCFLNLAYTLVNIPYAALLPELTKDFDQRTTLTGYRMSFAVVGTVLGAAAVLPLVEAFGDPRTGWLMMGTIMGSIITVTALTTVFAIKEPVHKEKYAGTGFLKTYIETLGLKVFLLAVIPWTLFVAGTTVVQGSLIYYFKYIYNDEGLFNIALIFLLGVSLLCIPIWVLLSKKIGKKKSYIIGMSIMTIGVMLFAFLGGEGRVIFAFVLMAAAGTGLSTHYVMPHSILPDVVEYDAIKSGTRREGVFSSLWTFSSKIGQAVALALTGFILDLVRYVPDTSLEPITLKGMRLLCGPVPAVFYIAGIVVLAAYPITRAFYDSMLRESKVPGAGPENRQDNE